MARIRIRCEVLRAVAINGPCTVKQLHEKLPHLKYKQVQKACYHLVDEDEIKKTGVTEEKAVNNTPWPIYEVRTDESPTKGRRKQSYRPPDPNRHITKLHKGLKFDEDKQRYIVKYRDNKIEYLSRLLLKERGDDKNLLIGMINDYNNL